ncbi:MAG TPA: translation initiation factor [Candidatus Marinimicrobia bacterium]|jgi:translation initiation factor 1|nr:translation initiation factor [Candidatus Neomarinimicrobiota bacterium]
MANSKLIFSTDDSVSLTDNTVQSLAIDPSQQRVRLHLDRKGGGKIVSIVRGLQESNDVLTVIAKDLKKGCGVGGSVKNGEILIQGNHREKIQKLLSKKGYAVKLSGG